MLGVSLSEDVSGELLQGGILDLHGWQLFINLVFLLSTASLGASFALLFKINRELENGGYEEDDDASYISTWILGIAAGMILAEVIPIDFIKSGEGSDQYELTKLILALLGGFASFLVYNILNATVDALGSVFVKDNREEISIENKKLKAEFRRESALKNAEMVSKLTVLKNSINNAETGGEVHLEVEKVIRQVMGEDDVEVDQ
jgi:hypothetical protein